MRVRPRTPTTRATPTQARRRSCRTPLNQSGYVHDDLQEEPRARARRPRHGGALPVRPAARASAEAIALEAFASSPPRDTDEGVGRQDAPRPSRAPTAAACLAAAPSEQSGAAPQAHSLVSASDAGQPGAHRRVGEPALSIGVFRTPSRLGMYGTPCLDEEREEEPDEVMLLSLGAADGPGRRRAHAIAVQSVREGDGDTETQLTVPATEDHKTGQDNRHAVVLATLIAFVSAVLRQACVDVTADALRYWCRCRRRTSDTNAAATGQRPVPQHHAREDHHAADPGGRRDGGGAATPSSSASADDDHRPPANPANHFKQVLKGYKMSPEAFSASCRLAKIGRRKDFMASLESVRIPVDKLEQAYAIAQSAAQRARDRRAPD